MKLICGHQIESIERHLAIVLSRSLFADGLAPLNNAIRAFVLRGGKRTRPQLCVWTYLRIQKDLNEELPIPLLDLACGWELLHSFLLAHDDIIDNAERRHDQKSLHRELASLDHDTHKFGVNLGIVAGDLLFSAAMQLWHSLELPAHIYRSQLQLFSRIALTTGFGQAIDICQSQAPLDSVSEALLLREYHWKTAAYTFEGPMLSAAILAGADDATQSAISKYALALGQAYQLQNDLIDLGTEAVEGCDLMEGKRTLTLIRARAALGDRQRATFDDRFNRIPNANGQAVRIAEELRRELCAAGAIERSRELIDTLLDEARAAANDAAMPKQLGTASMELLETLGRQYFTPVHV